MRETKSCLKSSMAGERTVLIPGCSLSKSGSEVYNNANRLNKVSFGGNLQYEVSFFFLFKEVPELIKCQKNIRDELTFYSMSPTFYIGGDSSVKAVRS